MQFAHVCCDCCGFNGVERNARALGVFDHTFFYVEGAFQDVSNFGQPGFVLSPREKLLRTNLPVVLSLGVAIELM